MIAAAASLGLLLGGCATTIRSDVTTFHQWPAQIADKSYAFEAPAPQDNTLELQNYQNLVRGQLARLGFHEARQPRAEVAMRFTTTDVPTQVLYPAYAPFYPYSARSATPAFAAATGAAGPTASTTRSGAGAAVRGGEDTATTASCRSRSRRRRQQATVRRDRAQRERTMSTPAVMPALVQSAFEGFPGPNGGSRVVELKQEPPRTAESDARQRAALRGNAGGQPRYASDRNVIPTISKTASTSTASRRPKRGCMPAADRPADRCRR